MQGLEDVLAEEIALLGGENIEPGRRMVSFTGDKELLYKANLQLRTALRILKPIYRFSASNTDEVYDQIKSFNWDKFLSPDKTFAIDSVVYSDEFKHSKFVTYRTKDAIADYFAEKYGKRPSVRINNADILLNLHISQHNCTLSLDSSGESLHKRGYRVDQTEAPINEVLAAGLILKTGWRGDKNFIDPMCGSGTFLIEAALIATRTAPGIYRKDFAFERWPDYDEELFDRLYNDDSMETPFEYKIYGSDISPKAVSIAERNIKSAGMSKYIELNVQPFQQCTEAPENGVLVTNPPYGERITSEDLLGLYSMIGERLKHVFKGYDCWIISYRDDCFDRIGLKPALKLEMMNGALECQYRKYEIFDGKYRDFKQKTGGFREKKRETAQFPAATKKYGRIPEKRGQKEERRFPGEDEKWQKPKMLHGEEAIEKFVTFKLPSIQDPDVDNRPGWKRLRDRYQEQQKALKEKSRKKSNDKEVDSSPYKKRGSRDEKPLKKASRSPKPSFKEKPANPKTTRRTTGKNTNPKTRKQ
ncbi:MAG: RNA methyltransferase [Coprobacter sp.]|nr:RNA methyltransferase [Coprobacter sp.]